MASNDDLPVYPKGQIGFGTGNLKTATNAKYSFKNGAKLKHSIAQTPSGVTFGHQEVTGSIDFEISENGPERDIVNDVRSGTKRQFRFKDATTTDTIIGVLDGIDKEIPSDDCVKVTATFVGKLVKA